MDTLTHGLPTPGASARHANQQLIFDFTKRKRWADLLVTELTEAIMLVLSETGVVWYCGHAVEDLLGWADEDLVDGTLFEIMNENDRGVFERQFEDAVQKRTDLLSYVRMRCKSEHDRYGPNIPIIPSPANVDGTHGHSSSTSATAKEVLFEIKGYAHHVNSSTLSASLSGFDVRDLHALASTDNRGGPPTGAHQDGTIKCFFAMAKPYPSRNSAMLNTFLELKVENERLQQRLRDAKAKEAELDRLEARRHGLPAFTLAQPPSPYAGSGSSGAIPPTQSFTWTPAAGVNRSFDAHQYYGADVSAGGAAGVGGVATGPLASPGAGESADPSGDHTLPRKKGKKGGAQEMHCCMTCGRTESPEWRKGPQGPKTLCNACGLRWAKSSRTSAPEGEGATHPQ